MVESEKSQNQDWNSVFQPPALPLITGLDSRIFSFTRRTVWLSFNPLPPSLREPTEEQWESSSLSLAHGTSLILNMMGGRGLLKAGWGCVPSAFAGGLEALQPEVWHGKEIELLSNIEN